MTPKERAAMQQALNALEELHYSSGTVVAARMYESATAALREALAEQAECKECGAKQAQIDRLMLEYCPDETTPEQMLEWGNNQRPAEQTEQEPFKMICPRCKVDRVTTQCPNRGGIGDCPMTATAQSAAPVQQAEQGPVAYISRGGLEELKAEGRTEIFAERDYECAETLPLYTAPVRTKDLTDDEIERALDAAKVPELPDGYKSVDLEIARAVIAADRELNK